MSIDQPALTAAISTLRSEHLQRDELDGSLRRVVEATCSLFAVVRDGVATALRSDTVLKEGDKVIAIGKADCERMLHEQLIGTTSGEPAG